MSSTKGLDDHHVNLTFVTLSGKKSCFVLGFAIVKGFQKILTAILIPGQFSQWTL